MSAVFHDFKLEKDKRNRCWFVFPDGSRCRAGSMQEVLLYAVLKELQDFNARAT